MKNKDENKMKIESEFLWLIQSFDIIIYNKYTLNILIILDIIKLILQ